MKNSATERMKQGGKAENKMHRVMKEFKEGKLKSHGHTVTDRKQAIAIGLSSAREENPKYQMKDGGIANQYENKAPFQVWNDWDRDQRSHFLQDHNIDFKNISYKQHSGNIYPGLGEISFRDLHQNVKSAITDHVTQGQYHEGGEINKLNTTYSFWDLFTK